MPTGSAKPLHHLAPSAPLTAPGARVWRAARLLAFCVILGAEIALLRAVVRLLPPAFYLPLVPKARVSLSTLTGYDEPLDPVVGASLPVALDAPASPPESTRALPSGGAAILVIGSCSSCGADTARPWAALCSQAQIPLYLVTSDSPDRVQEFVGTEMIECVPVLDRDLAISRRLNAVWTPRAYLVAPDGKLAFVQPVAMPDETALRTAAAIIASWREEDAD